MKNEFVSYEQAVALKELGFNEECFKYIYIGDTGNNYDHYLEVEPLKAKKYNEDDLCISQPLKQQVFRWFREKYNLCSIVFNDDGDIEHSNVRFNYEIRAITFSFKDLTNEKNACVGKYDYKTYEEAENACLIKLIEIAKQK